MFPLQGFFQELCHNTVFVIQIKFVKSWRAQGRAMVVYQGANPSEVQRTWALRISYFSLKLVIFCKKINEVQWSCIIILN